jgi:hypothetical protein
MLNSHQPQYGDTYYARLKGLEREFVHTASDPHVVMLTLTASNRNENGGWRCPADHLRDIIESFTDHVRPALHRALGSNGADVENWEYARVVEHHRSGYGHVHIAIFIDGNVSEEHFRPVIDTHLRHCEPAGAGAHNYYSQDSSERPISASRVDAELQPEEYENVESVVGNLGSYVAEYIGSHGTELFKRDISELAFRATCWATSTNRVDFSNGAQKMISADLDTESEPSNTDESINMDCEGQWATEEEIQEVETDPEKTISDLSTDRSSWQFDGIGIVDNEGESQHSVQDSGVAYVSIDGSEHLDPPKKLPPNSPTMPTTDSDLNRYH